MNKKYILIILILAVLLTACVDIPIDVVQTVEFLGEERWKGEVDYAIPAEAIALLGGLTELETLLTEAAEEAELEGDLLEWEITLDEETNLYHIALQGESDSFEKLEGFLYADSTQITIEEIDGQQTIHIVQFHSPTEGQTTTTFIGGEILDSNGTLLDDGTVQWVNQFGQLEAQLTPKSSSPLPIILLGLLLCLCLVVVAAGGGFFLYRRQQDAQKITGEPI